MPQKKRVVAKWLRKRLRSALNGESPPVGSITGPCLVTRKKKPKSLDDLALAEFRMTGWYDQDGLPISRPVSWVLLSVLWKSIPPIGAVALMVL